MLGTIKKLIVEPSDTFANIEERSNLGQVVPIVILFGLLSAVPELLAIRHPIFTGAALLILTRLAGTLIIWGLMGIVIYGLAVKMSHGAGNLNSIYVATGLAAFIRLLQSFAESLVAMGGWANPAFLMVFFGWYSVLLVLAVREVNKVTTGRSIMVVILVGIVSLAVSLPLTLVEWVIYPHLTGDPFAVEPRVARRVEGWDDAELPDVTENLLRNPGFTEFLEDDVPGTEEMALEEREIIPKSWLGMPIVIRTPNQRDALLINKVKYTFERDPSEGMESEASGLVSYTGVPVGLPLAWGWAQLIASREFITDFRRREEERSGEDGRKRVERWELESSVVRFREDDDFFFSIYLKGQDVVGATAFAVVRVNDQEARTFYSSQTLRGDFGWTEVRMRIPVPAGTQGVVVGAALWGGGKLWMDDGRVLRLASAVEETPEPEEPPELLPDAPASPAVE